MTAERDIALIEAYLAGGLSADERIKLEKRKAEDAEFAELFNQHAWTMDGFEGMQLEAVESELRRIRVKPRNRWLRPLIAVAASILLFFSLRTLFFSSGPSVSELADASYEAPVSLVERNGEGPLPAPLRQAFIAYSNREWANAAGQFEASANGPEANTANYYRAHCYYQLSRFEDAGNLFSDLLEDPRYGQQAQWFSAICLLKRDLAKAAEEQLGEIASNPGHFYRGKARALLEKLASSS